MILPPGSRALVVAALMVVAGGQGCAPVMIEREGHDIFNPFYRGFLDWDRRDEWQQPGRVLDTLAIAPGLVVADVGAGTGYFTRRLAERVGPAGRVYATDVHEVMLADLRRMVRTRGLDNVEIVHAAFDDPTLPDACCDLLFLANVYKEIDDRVRYMRKVGRALKPTGRVAIVGFPPDGPGIGPPRDVRLSAAEVITELHEAGFALTERHDFLPRQYLMVFALAGALEAGATEAHCASGPVRVMGRRPC